MLAAVIAIVAVVAMFGSMMWMRPSPAQQRQTEMRLLARQLGLDVRLASLPQTRRARVRQEAPRSGIVYRRLQYDDRKSAVRRDYLWCRSSADSPWEIEDADGLAPALREQVEALFEQLPADAAAVELTMHGPGVYWQERGGVEAVRMVAELLQQLQQLTLLK